MTDTNNGIVFYAPPASSRGGRKKKFIKVGVHHDGATSLSLAKRHVGDTKPKSLPELIKMNALPDLLGVSRATVYRMTKKGLKTIRPTNGDQYVRREDLEAFLGVREVENRRR